MTKMSLFKGDFTTPGFSNQKKGIFHDQNLDVHIFFLFMDSKPYSHGEPVNRQGFSKKKIIFWFF